MTVFQQKRQCYNNNTTISRMQIQNPDQRRNAELKKQRKIEINNNGIPVIFQLGNKRQQQNSSLQVQNNGDQLILKSWLEDRFSINIYSANGWNQLATINKNEVHFLSNCLHFNDRKIQKVLTNGFTYILARNNATIELLSSALCRAQNIDPEIYEFLNNPGFEVLESNKMFNLEQWAYHNLNESQKSAIQLITKQKIAFIKGPPGCGKTRLIARLATIFSYNGLPILVGAVSNTANMTILSAILKQSQQMNFIPNVVLFISKELASENMKHPPTIRCCTFRYKLMMKLMQVAGYEDTFQNWNYLELLLDSFWKGENIYKTFISIYYQATALVFYEANVVIVTTASAIKLDFKLDQSQKFKPFIGILDEAAQASWADAYCFLNKNVKKMVFIGDDKQLAPTVISQNQTLKQTIFSKLFKKNKKYYVLLNHQYRMHPAISEFPNIYFYEGQLKNGVTPSDRQSKIQFFNKYPLSFINSEQPEQEYITERSGKRNYFNIAEIQIIKKILSMFSKEQFVNIGIISPYDMQIRYIRYMLGEEPFAYGLTVKTCDGYQGSQKDFVIVSCVRSNKEGKIGFCNEENRLNVTITRARRGLVLIGNKNTFLSQNQPSNVWHKYLEYLQGKNLIIEENELQSYKKQSHFENKQLSNLEQATKKMEMQESQAESFNQISQPL